MRLSSALDKEVLLAAERFIANGISSDIPSIYAAIQKSNSSLKRQQKKTISASIERVLEYLGVGDDEFDSEAAIDDLQPDPVAELMNKSLRANLSSRPANPLPMPDDEEPRRRKTNGEPVAKRQKRAPEEKLSITPPMDVSLEDVGGMGDIIAQMNERIIMPIGFYEEFQEAKFPMPKGILLHGPPGCGKTMLCRAYAAELGVPFIEILGPSIVSGMSGESEKAVREKFDEAKKNAPCLVFIDEIDAIAPKRDTSQSQMEKRIVAQLLVSMDDLQSSSKPVIVLAATNRPDSLDPALRRGGRFGTEININVPNEPVRERILRTQTREMKVSPDVDFPKLAKMTGGFVGADLHDLVGKAAAHQMKRLQQAMENQAVELSLIPSTEPGLLQKEVLSARRLLARIQHRELPRPFGFEAITISMVDFTSVLPLITPSSKREGFTTIPDVSWKDIGALESVREELKAAIINPIENPGLYEHFGMDTPSGVLLWGPPGCGKTLLAKAAAAESKANFISIKGPELLNKFVGESEAAVRKVFQRARSSIPCVIFFDELDALVPKRDESASEASSRVVNTLLTELDGLSVRTGIYVIAATNRPDMIDEAMLRPGRLGTTLFVDLPGPEERYSILQALVHNKPCVLNEAIKEIVERCDGYSGADVGALLREATLHAIKRGGKEIQVDDFTYAAGRVRGSVKDVKKYHRLKASFGQR